MSFAQLDFILSPFKAWAHDIAPVGSVTFNVLAWMSLGLYLLFAVVALHYALKPWAEKALLGSIGCATAASMVLYLSIQSAPAYAGEGTLWKFVTLSQYLPWAVISLGVLYVVYRLAGRLFKTGH
jgi:hypothetical protein